MHYHTYRFSFRKNIKVAICKIFGHRINDNPAFHWCERCGLAYEECYHPKDWWVESGIVKPEPPFRMYRYVGDGWEISNLPESDWDDFAPAKDAKDAIFKAVPIVDGIERGLLECTLYVGADRISFLPNDGAFQFHIWRHKNWFQFVKQVMIQYCKNKA